jgi:diaminopimelate decarboxylase
MVRAIDPKKVKNISDIGNAYKRKIPNVSLNLETGAYEVTNAAGAVVKTIAVEKGYDATYVINRSSKEEDVESSGL